MKIVCIFSGGMDSATMLKLLIEKGNEVKAISFDYGQRHKKELDYARDFTKDLGIEHKVVDLTVLNELLQGSSLTSKEIEVPEGHYEEPSMKATVVPNRNMIMLSIAIGYAVSLDFDAIAIGVHSGDHAIYLDCREDFIKRVNQVAEVANYKPIRVLTPFLDIDKKMIAKIGKELKVDYSKTWTCYKGLQNPCGKCGSCVERQEALESI